MRRYLTWVLLILFLLLLLLLLLLQLMRLVHDVVHLLSVGRRRTACHFVRAHLSRVAICITLAARPLLEAIGIRVLDQPFFARGNVASAGGCLASPYLATWVILRLLGHDAAKTVLRSVAPVGEKDSYVARALGAVSPFIETVAEDASAGRGDRVHEPARH